MMEPVSESLVVRIVFQWSPYSSHRPAARASQALDRLCSSAAAAVVVRALGGRSSRRRSGGNISGTSFGAYRPLELRASQTAPLRGVVARGQCGLRLLGCAPARSGVRQALSVLHRGVWPRFTYPALLECLDDERAEFGANVRIRRAFGEPLDARGFAVGKERFWSVASLRSKVCWGCVGRVARLGWVGRMQKRADAGFASILPLGIAECPGFEPGVEA